MYSRNSRIVQPNRCDRQNFNVTTLVFVRLHRKEILFRGSQVVVQRRPKRHKRGQQSEQSDSIRMTTFCLEKFILVSRSEWSARIQTLHCYYNSESFARHTLVMSHRNCKWSWANAKELYEENSAPNNITNADVWIFMSTELIQNQRNY